MNHVLVVDDERVIADTLCLILKAVGYSARVAYTGEQALEIAALDPPDMLISDVIMPGIHGFDLAIKMVKQLPDCAVLLLSGQAATADLIASSERAGHSFELLLKPVHPQEIIAAVKRNLDPKFAISPGALHR